MKKTLLIGGAGYIGLKVTDYLLASGEQVCCVDNGTYQNLGLVSQFWGNKNYDFIFGNMGDVSVLEKALENVTDVVLLAGLVGDPITKKFPIQSEQVNDVELTDCLKFLNGRGLDRVVFISTCSNYGLIPDDQLATEESELSPLSSYARSKVHAESFLLSMKGSVDYSPTVLRFATAFGIAPRMRFDLTVNEFSRDLALGRELLVYDPDTWRPYCHVNDFAMLIHKTLRACKSAVGFEVFNAGGDENNFTKREIVNTILKHLPCAADRVAFREHGNDPRNYRVSFQKVKEVIGFQPTFTVEDGVLEVINAVQNRVFDQHAELPNIYGNYDLNVSSVL